MTIKALGRYQCFLPAIGHGGMGQVFRASDPRTNREVAVKTLHPLRSGNENIRQRFRHEAKVIARLDHYAIVPIYDFDDEADEPYIVMRYMKGGSLMQKINEGSIPVEEALAILERICSALDRAHLHKIVHRDLKPDNILFDDEDKAYLADFGIARLIAGTQTTTQAGTPAYMAPEQFDNVDLSAQTDVYQIGIVFFQMITGKLPYKSNTWVSIIREKINNRLPSVCEFNPSLPPAYDVILAKATAKEPQERYESAGEFVRAVSSVVTNRLKPPVTPQAFDSTYIARRLIELTRVGVETNFRPYLPALLGGLENRHLVADIVNLLDLFVAGEKDLDDTQGEIAWRLQNGLETDQIVKTIEKLYSMLTLANITAVSQLQLNIGRELTCIKQWQVTPNTIIFGEIGDEPLSVSIQLLPSHFLLDQIHIDYVPQETPFPFISLNKYDSKAKGSVSKSRRKDWIQLPTEAEDLSIYDKNSRLKGKIVTRVEQLPVEIKSGMLSLQLQPECFKSAIRTTIYDGKDNVLGQLIKISKE